MKPFKFIFLASLLLTAPANADSAAKYQAERETINVMADLILLRPASVAMTVAGTALFVGLSPFTALASIAPPHDAFVRAANALIGTPACYAFHRPLGENRFTGQYAKDQSFCTW